jgi:hypothetical protein
MTSSISLKKLVSVGAALLIAVGGSLASASPALAAGPTPDSFFPPNFYGASQPFHVADTVVVASNNWSSQLISASHQWYSCDASNATVTDTNACTAINNGPQSAGSNQGATLSTTYVVQQSDLGRWLKIAVTATSAGGASSPYIVSANAAVVASATATFDPNGGVAGSTTSLTGTVIWLPSVLHGGSGSLPTRTGCSFSGWATTTDATFGDQGMSATILSSNVTYYAVWSGGSSCRTVAPAPGTGARPLTPEQARNQIKPLPTIVQPLVAALPALSKPLIDAGGKVDLKSGDFSGLVSASISGKPLDITLGSTGSLTITVPNGKAGTTADLLLNFKSGTVILQDAIKYVAPVVVANVPVRLVAIKSGAKKLSSAAADSVRLAAFANLANNSIECVAYASSAATADAAKATAQQACDLAVKANPNLVNVSVSVAIDKIKAATQGVGIKVYH